MYQPVHPFNLPDIDFEFRTDVVSREKRLHFERVSIGLPGPNPNRLSGAHRLHQINGRRPSVSDFFL